MFDANCIIIGERPYGENNNYKALEIENYPTGIVAFFPEILDENYNLYELDTYRRIQGFLHSKPLSNLEINNLDSPKKLVENYLKKKIYFINQDKITVKESKILYGDKAIFSINNTKIICFGNYAIDKFKNFSNTVECPHPSSQVSHKFWDKYDEKYRNDYDFDFDFQTFYNTLK
ncbi:hypothetical protein QI345_04685 [Staphylococcus saprophyticus]|nr:hypothetical protein [Staphylococcus saprophyticus]